MDTVNLSNYNQQQNKHLVHSIDYNAHEISHTKLMSVVEIITMNFRLNIYTNTTAGVI